MNDASARTEDFSEPDERRLAELLDAYVMALERGESPSVAELTSECPELAAVLNEYLDGVRLLHTAMTPASSARASSPRASSAPPSPRAANQADDRSSTLCEATGATKTDSKEPRRLGDYELVREIGRGGMGVVYEARQVSLNRRVALKMLPFAAVLEERQIARFRTEAQAAAALHHPNIVPVFAVGQERGVHFYAMQHISGQSLAEAVQELRASSEHAAGNEKAIPEAETHGVDAGASTLGEGTSSCCPLSAPGAINSRSFFKTVAQLGVQAAEALEHAHQYGVVHRDIKPSNLLIDQAGKLWVTDFGLARVQTEMSVTRSGDIIGTLRYMSPEQALGRGDLVDGRTDVYALGATLYELLTLRPAYPGDNPKAITERIESSDPPAPRRLNPATPIDLETIVLRAMEKSRDDRYTTAQQLADDLRRFLEGASPLARRPTVVERAGKWLARHRRAALGVAAALVAVTAVSVTSAVWVAAAGRETAAALQQAETNLALAQSHYRQARVAVDHFGGNLADRLADLPGADQLRRELLGDTLTYYQSFLQTAGRDADLRDDLAATHFKSGAIAHRLGDLAGARRSYARAIMHWARTTEADQDRPPMNAQRTSLLALGLRSLGRVESEAGRHAEALKHLDQSIALSRALAEESPDEPGRRHALAEALVNRGIASRATGDKAAGVAAMREAVASFGLVIKLAPERTGALRGLAVANSNLSEALREESPEEARECSELAIASLQRLAETNPEEDGCRSDLAMSLNNLAAIDGSRGDWRRAVEGYQRAVEQIEQLLARRPLLPRGRRELAITLGNLGLAHAHRGDNAASDAAFDRAAQTLDALVNDMPGQPAYAASLAALRNNRGVALQLLGRPEEAIAAFADAVAWQEEQAGQGGAVRATLAKSYRNYEAALRKAGMPSEAQAINAKLRDQTKAIESSPIAPAAQAAAFEKTP